MLKNITSDVVSEAWHKGENFLEALLVSMYSQDLQATSVQINDHKQCKYLKIVFNRDHQEFIDICSMPMTYF